jgi:hypothetical protein
MVPFLSLPLRPPVKKFAIPLGYFGLLFRGSQNAVPFIPTVKSIPQQTDIEARQADTPAKQAVMPQQNNALFNAFSRPLTACNALNSSSDKISRLQIPPLRPVSGNLAQRASWRTPLPPRMSGGQAIRQPLRGVSAAVENMKTNSPLSPPHPLKISFSSLTCSD